MTCANVITRLGTPVSVMSMDKAMGFRRRSHRIGASSPKPLRPCITTHHPAFAFNSSPAAAAAAGDAGRREKRVAFADSRGLSLITVRLFSERDLFLKSPEPLTRRHRVKEPRKLRLGFDQPCSDVQAFGRRLRERAVLLERCEVARRSVRGTVRVRNICFDKAVHIRITFDAWRSYSDVPCTYLDQRCGEPGTDVFEFNVAVPEETTRTPGRIEFCVSYSPAGAGAAEWDNNNGKNYSVHVCDG